MTMKTSIRANPRYLLFAALMMVLAIAALPKLAVANSTSNFNVPLTPNWTARTPLNYTFGTGAWTGTIHYGDRMTTITSQVALSGAVSYTWFIMKESYVSASGQFMKTYYWAMWVDGSGSGQINVNSHVPKGAVAVVLGVYDASHFFPPLQTMISDPEIGGDEAD